MLFVATPTVGIEGLYTPEREYLNYIYTSLVLGLYHPVQYIKSGKRLRPMLESSCQLELRT
jgi:hypothetical protein